MEKILSLPAVNFYYFYYKNMFMVKEVDIILFLGKHNF